ncbi:MAG: flagellin [Pseudomonadota bacterium]
MASILTNNSAMVALQTLRSINSGLEGVQSEISTGLKIGTSKDDAAIFAISEVMRSDVSGFEAIKSSLDLGSSTLNVASNAVDSIGNLLEEIKGKIVAAGNPSADATIIQNEITSLVGQVDTIISAAQFNGVNLIDGSTATDFSILSSLDRSATGVTTSTISLDTSGGAAVTNLGTTAGAVRGGLTGSLGATTNADDATFSLAAGATAGTNIVVIDDTNLAAGDTISISVDNFSASVVLTAADVAAGDTEAVVATALRDQLVGQNIAGLVVDYNSTAANTLVFTNNGTGNVDRVVTSNVTSAGSGGLSALSAINVVTDQAGALTSIETLIQTTVTAQAAIGTVETRVELQASFQQSLIDSFKTGIGGLVDADLEEASARLQALQVQQQLATQSLSIANQAPQNILSLFR